MSVARFVISSILVAVSGLPMAGCVTHHWTSPPLEGDIVDSATGKPISGVVISKLPKSGEEEMLSESDSLGHFKVEARRKTIFGVPVLVYLGDYFYRGKFELKKAGYSPLEISYTTSSGDDFSSGEGRSSSSLFKLTPNAVSPE
jgi:hypothetical protein